MSGAIPPYPLTEELYFSAFKDYGILECDILSFAIQVSLFRIKRVTPSSGFFCLGVSKELISLYSLHLRWK